MAEPSAATRDRIRAATETRYGVERQTQDVFQSRTMELNAAVQASYIQLEQKVETMVQKLDTVLESQREMLRLFQGLSVVVTSTRTTTIGAVQEIPPVMRRGQEQRTAFGRLPSTPVLPLIPQSLPVSMKQLLIDHEQLYKLTRYDQASTRRGWPIALNLSYNRRKYLYTHLISRANRLRNNMNFDRKKEEAAKRMDEEIRSRNLTGTSQYCKFLKSTDPRVKSRKRKAARA